MWPWGHLAVGYLLYSVGLRRRDRRPQWPQVVLLAVGAVLPDLVDKPLAWSIGFLGSGRSLGHSLVVAVVVIGLLYVLLPRRNRSALGAFAVGYLSHPLADFPYREVLAGEFEFLAYLVWPLLPPPPYETEPTSIIAHVMTYELGLFQAFEWLLVGLAIGLWYRDGCPGVVEVRSALRAVVNPQRR